MKGIWRNLYPFESHMLDVDGGLRLHYVDEQKGVRAGQPPREVLLFVHGNPTWSFYWRNLITHFRDRYRAVAVDHIGCGLSDKPTEKQYSFRLEQRVADLTRLIEQLDLQNITLVAHDWGGAIGMGAAEQVPDRIKRLVLLNTAAFRSSRFPLRIRVCRTPFLGRFAMQGLNLFCQAELLMATATRRQFTKPVRAGYLAPYHDWASRLAVYKFVQDIPFSEKHPSYATLQAIEEGLHKFQDRPVCLMWGMLDWCFSPEYLKTFLQFYPEATVHKYEDAGHYVVEDAIDRITPDLEAFLGKDR